MFLSMAPSPLPMVASGARPREPAPERGASGPELCQGCLPELLLGASGRAPDDCEASRALAATRRRLPAAKKAARRRAGGQSTAQR